MGAAGGVVTQDLPEKGLNDLAAELFRGYDAEDAARREGRCSSLSGESENSVSEKGVQLRLQREESLVLYHFLLRYTTRHEHDIEHEAERLVLHKLCLTLCDKLAEEIDSPDYDALVDAAREQLHAKWRQSTDDRPVDEGK
jgi:hypothetical protein